MGVLTLIFAALGFMEQSYRGSLLTTIILMFNFMGIFAGYYSARIYKMFNVINQSFISFIERFNCIGN